MWYYLSPMSKTKTIEIAKVSDQEKNWVKMLSEGKQALDICEKEDINANTLATKLRLLRERCRVKTTNELVAYFIKNGLI